MKTLKTAWILTIAVLGLTVGLGSTPALANGQLNWDGNGITNGELDKIICGDPRTIHWVFTLGGNNTVGSATLYVNGDAYTGTQQDENFSFYSGWYNLSTLSTTTVYVVYTGETGKKPNLNVSHGCPPLPLEITKTAETSYTRNWTWTIEKTADKNDLGILEKNQIYEVNYVVKLNATSADSNHIVQGTITITITNPYNNPPARIEGVTNELDYSTSVIDIICDNDNNEATPFGGFPYDLAGGSSLTCSYKTEVSGKNDSLDTATVIIDGVVPGNSATTTITWNGPSEELDECVTVTDTNSKGPQEIEICVSDLEEGFYEFSYALSFSKNLEEADVKWKCGQIEYQNTASFISNDNGQAGNSVWTVLGKVNCEQCWCSPGFWARRMGFGIRY